MSDLAPGVGLVEGGLHYTEIKPSQKARNKVVIHGEVRLTTPPAINVPADVS